MSYPNCCLPYNCCSYNWMQQCCMRPIPPRTDDWRWKSMLFLCGKDERDQLKKVESKKHCAEIIKCMQQKDPSALIEERHCSVVNPILGANILEPKDLSIPFVKFNCCESFLFPHGRSTIYLQEPTILKHEEKCRDAVETDHNIFIPHKEVLITPKEQQFHWYRKHRLGPQILYTPVDICVIPKTIVCENDTHTRTEHHLLFKRRAGESPTTYKGRLEPYPSRTAKFVRAK